MKNDNPKYVIALVLFVLLFVGVYFWQKYRLAMGLIASNAAAKPATGAAGTTIAANTIAGTVKDKYYQYGSGKIYFGELTPSTYKSPELLSFTPNMANKSAFKSRN